MDYNIKSIRQDFKDKGIFYTTKELAMYLKSFFPNDVKEIYDPTCGNGGLLSVFDDEVIKYGQDINEPQVRFAQENLCNFNGVVGDTLANPAFMGKKFKYIIANPPFSIKWEQISDERFKDLPALPPKSKADYAFLTHILYYLADDGMAVVLNFPGILYRGNSEGKIRQWFVDNNYIDTVIAIDGGYFVDTKIATAVLILKKNKQTTDVKFIHNEKELLVRYDEIKKNNYNLTVSYYIVEEPEKEEINPSDLENKARKSFLEKLRKELDFEKMVCEMEGISMQPFLNDIKKIVREFENENKQREEPQETGQMNIYDFMGGD